MRLQATTALALSQEAVVLARHAKRLLSGAGPDRHSRPLPVALEGPLCVLRTNQMALSCLISAG